MTQTELDPTENLKRIRPDVLTHSHLVGEDFPGEKYMRKIGKKSIRTEYTKGISTTKIMNKIKARQWVRPHTLRPKGTKTEAAN